MKLSSPIQYYLVNLCIIVFFVFLAVYSHLSIERQQNLEVKERLDSALDQFSLNTVAKMQSSVEKLRSISSIVAFSDDVSFEDFSSYAQSYLGEDKNWALIEWQPIIAGEERAAFETQIRAQGFSDFYLWQPNDSGEPVVAATRDMHVPVLYMVATTGVADTMGLDLAWSEERMQSKWQSRDQGRAQLSGFFDLVLAQDNSFGPAGFAITLPVFINGVTPKNTPLRREKIKGYLAGVYAVSDMFESDLRNLSNQGLLIEIADSEFRDTPFRLIPDDTKAASLASLYEENTVSLYGRTWEIRLTATPAFLSAQPSSPWKLLPLVLLICCLAFLAFVHWLFNRNQQLSKIQDDLQNALQRVTASEKFYEEQSRHDPLTGLLNRRAFVESLNSEISRSHRYHEELSLLIVDIDDFKQINDRYGHPVGDLVLQRFALQCKALAREHDILCRFGGEEFALLLIKTNAEEAQKIAERYRASIAQMSIASEQTEHIIQITISGGLAQCCEDDTPSSLITRADKALYVSKNNGKNQISSAI